ncbi:MAG TPA: S41 family peptidase [Chitinophagaceae bacterium]|nr:S41 family peptidase [Chitinophagaceae bacterium]
MGAAASQKQSYIIKLRIKALLMRAFALITFILGGQLAFGQDTGSVCVQRAGKLLDEAFGLMKKYYYKKDSVPWSDLFTAAKSRLNNAGNCQEANETLQWCFREMKEKHSFILPPEKASLYNGNINSSKEPVELSRLIGPLRHEMVEDGIAYIDIPWITTADEKICTGFADSLQGVISSYDKQGVTKWIIDLRNNTGGNCWPMLAGLGPLIGNGVYGYFVSNDERIPFSYQNGVAMQGRHTRCAPNEPRLLSQEKKTIIVLTGPNTASAGEIVALAFRGMDNVYIYGEPTAGLTTANATYNLSDGSILVLTVCKEADRNGKVQDGRIQPDKIIESAILRGMDQAKTAALMFLQLD